MPTLADSYYARATELLTQAREKNTAALAALTPIIGRSIAAGSVLHTFGSGHSEMIAREIIGRAGGLMPVTGLFDPGYGFSENIVGYGTRLAERHDHHYGLRAGETIIVISNSGKNASPIEVALYAKQKGLTVVGLTSLAMSTTAKTTGREISVLNLFGYTGAATCAAAAGASVCHVDAAEGMVKWCRENSMLSGLSEAPIRFITDDCLKFVRREIKRGRRYDAVIMDPPTYGRGSSGEMWKLEDQLWELLQECQKVLSDQPLFFLINAYTARLSPTVVVNLLAELFHQSGGTITGGEVGLPVKCDGKTLPCGIYGRWEA